MNILQQVARRLARLEALDKVAKPATGRVTEQGIDAGGGVGLTRRPVPVSSRSARRGRVMAWRIEDVD
jgi:hypothetical protein